MRLRGLVLLLVFGLFAGGVLAHEAPAWKPDANVAREAVPDIYKWNLGQLFKSDEEWDAAVVKLSGEVAELAQYQGKLADPKALHGALALYFRLHDEINHTTLYANLKLTTAQSCNKTQAMQQRSLALMDALMQSAGFIRTELLALEDTQMMAAYGIEPKLRKHAVYIENLRRRRARVLSPEAERVLALAGDNL